MGELPTPVVTFVPADFRSIYPEFAALTDGQLNWYFAQAGLYCANAAWNPAWRAGVLPTLLTLLTAHVAWLSAPRDANGNPAATGAPASPIVGRINSASEGSVSVGAEFASSGSPSEAWFIQTKYGAAFWQASAQFRTARYSARPTIVPGGGLPRYAFGRRFTY